MSAAIAAGSKVELDATQGGSAANARALADVCRLALDNVLASLAPTAGAPLPHAVRTMLGALRLLVTQKFDAAVARTAVGAVLFLRFICPALAAPDAYGLVHSACVRACVRARVGVRRRADAAWRRPQTRRAKRSGARSC